MNTIQNKSSIFTNRAYEKGSTHKTTDILTATINQSQINGKYRLTFDDNTSLNVDKSLINGSVGDSIKVKIEQKNSSKVFVGQILENEKALNDIDMLQKSSGIVAVDSRYSDFLKENGIEASSENVNTLRDIKACINSIVNGGGEASVGKLLAMGIDIGNISLEVLSRFVYEANSYNMSAMEKTESFEEYISKNPQTAADDKRLAAAKALFEQGLPINENNISELKAAIENAENIVSLSENEIVEFLKSSSTVSFENIYKAKFSNSKSANNKADDKIWHKLEAQAEKLLDLQGMEPSEENLKTARLFIENDIPLTTENIKKADFLKNPSLDLSALLKAAALGLSQNKGSAQFDIFTYTQTDPKAQAEIYSNYEQSLKYINQADEYTIQKLIDKNQEINLKNIAKEVLSQSSPKGEYSLSQDAIKARRQLLEIQMKLSSEAAARLSQKGIDINIQPLKEAIAQLKEIENELFARELASAEVSPQSTEVMKQCMNKINALPVFVSKADFYGIVFDKQKYTLNEISAHAAEKILSSLDSFATTPRAKYGDSFAALKNSFEQILKGNNIETTRQNLRAAEILSRNGIDITQENILKVKLTDAKINFIYDKLHPMTAANMIREGINPLETDIDELVDYIKSFSDKYEQQDRDKIAQYIIEAEQRNDFSQPERTAVASVYRALSFICSKNSKGIGAAVFAQSSSTIGDILKMADAVEKAKKGIDKAVDDKNEIKINLASDNNIKLGVESALAQSLKDLDALREQYSSVLTDSIIDMAAPSQLIAFIRGNDDINKETVEKLYYGLKKISESSETSFISNKKIKALAQEIQSMENGANDIVKWLNENNIPLTLNNINAAAKLLNDAFKSAKELDELKESLEENDIGIEGNFDLEDIYSSAQNAVNSVERAGDEALMLEDITNISLILKRLEPVKALLRFEQSVNDNSENIYQIPIRLKDNTITNLNMYVLNKSGSNDGFKGFLNLETKNLGIVQCFLNVEKNSVFAKITAENPQSERFLKEVSASLYTALENVGFLNTQIEFASENSFNIFKNSDAELIKENLEEMKNPQQVDGGFSALV